VEGALASYVRRRKPRVEWVQRQSMGLANLLTASSAARNATLRERGTRLMQDRFGPLVPPP
jgi:2-polyprenyl-6-methoxyphenol hydroxylase-like FAD-dependent oxidoreductase